MHEQCGYHLLIVDLEGWQELACQAKVCELDNAPAKSRQDIEVYA
jgi:hypothetical protein